MALKFTPAPGLVVICDYETGFLPPEMVKERLAITISPKMKHRPDLVTVVPLSRTQPRQVYSWQVPVDIDIPYWGAIPRWAKCDMLATVGLPRLKLPHTKNAGTGARKFHTIYVGDEVVRQLRVAAGHAIGIVIE